MKDEKTLVYGMRRQGQNKPRCQSKVSTEVSLCGHTHRTPAEYRIVP